MSTVRPLPLAALVLVILLPLASQAQRGMAAGGGRSMGGMAGGRSFGARPAAPMRVGVAPVAARPGVVARPAAVRFTTPAGSTLRTTSLVVTTRFHHHHFFNNNNLCFGAFSIGFFNCTNPFFFNAGFNSGFFPFAGGWGGGWGSPLFDPYTSGYAQQQPAQEVVSNDNTANVQLAMEIQRLSDKIEEMNAQPRQAPAPRPQPQGSLSVQPPADSTAFIFRDGQRITTQNYAIVGDTLWVLGQHTAKKVSLANLDKAATEQANAANGIELHLPR